MCVCVYLLERERDSLGKDKQVVGIRSISSSLSAVAADDDYVSITFRLLLPPSLSTVQRERGRRQDPLG